MLRYSLNLQLVCFFPLYATSFISVNISLSVSNAVHAHTSVSLRQVLLEQPLKWTSEFGFLSDPLFLSGLQVGGRPSVRHNLPVNVLWVELADEHVATFISLPTPIPESAVGGNSSVLEVKLFVTEHTGKEIGVESDLTDLDLFSKWRFGELIDEVLVEWRGLGKHPENGVA